MTFVCRVMGHWRSKARARLVQGRWQSVCRHCGVKLVRLGPGQWIELGKLEEPA